MTTCGNKAVRYFVWVDGKTGYICDKHLKKMLSVARFLGFYVELHELSDTESDELCQQYIDDNEDR